jgi:hypothetical protein
MKKGHGSAGASPHQEMRCSAEIPLCRDHLFRSLHAHVPGTLGVVGDAPYQNLGRKHPARGVHLYSGQPTIVFLTVCAADRNP